jgi:hypothetical protein
MHEYDLRGSVRVAEEGSKVRRRRRRKDIRKVAQTKVGGQERPTETRVCNGSKTGVS